MPSLRPSRPEEVPRQKELWKAAFHDEDPYFSGIALNFLAFN